jgi:hypothetical protein
MMPWWLLIAALAVPGEWGFFGHRLINRSAVYTLPTEMIGWYKPELDFITDHAVDADKRRYATRHEAVRHYIDLDHWEVGDPGAMPRSWTKALALTLEVFHVEGTDTSYLLRTVPSTAWQDSLPDMPARMDIVEKEYWPRYYDDEVILSGDRLTRWFGEAASVHAKWQVRDALTPHGILPYHLARMQRQLTEAFRHADKERVLRLSADLGHYIGDACVPLLTTVNYNGQLTGQTGIHAFWESRIPELYAEREFDVVVGTAEYIEDPEGYFWQLVLDSHAEVDRVLSIEQALRDRFPADEQLCFEDRQGLNVLTPCEPFARAYHEAMEHMVETRFRAAVRALGCAWYTAWIDAGQPPVPQTGMVNRRTAEDEELDLRVSQGNRLGREHDH